MRVAVLGASGEIGQFVFRNLLNEGIETVPVVDRSLGPLLSRRSISPVRVDMLRPGTIRDAIRGCDCVVNCIMNKSESLTNKEKERLNIQYCRNLLNSCSKEGVVRLVHLSSIVVLPPRITTESVRAPNAFSAEKDWYTKAKIGSEKVLNGYLESNPLVIVVRPGIVYGATMNWSKVAFERTARGIIALPEAPGTCMAVHPLDVARLVARLLQVDASTLPRLLYAVNPEHVDWSVFFSTHAEMLGLSNRVKQVSSGVLYKEASLHDGKFSARFLKWLSRSPIVDSARDQIVKAYREGKKVRDSGNWSRMEPVSPSLLLPSRSELDMYRSSVDLRSVETGQSISFSYKVSFRKGCENAYLWWSNETSLG